MKLVVEIQAYDFLGDEEEVLKKIQEAILKVVMLVEYGVGINIKSEIVKEGENLDR